MYRMSATAVETNKQQSTKSSLLPRPCCRQAAAAKHATHHPTTSISGHFIYIPYNKNTIRKSGLYGFRVTYVTRLEMGLPSEKVDYTV